MLRQRDCDRLILPVSCFALLTVAVAQVVAEETRNELSVLMEIDDSILDNVELRPGDWLSHGRDSGEQRFSPLDQISAENVARLGLAWSYATGTRRGLEATPLVVDGVMYTSGAWSKVYAIDARTGKKIWSYDPEIDGKYGARACCDVVNRGVAVYKGKVIVAALDGRLIALDGATGKPLWEKLTIDPEKPYTITGAPRIANGKVIIGNGGAELGVRGYVSAYDAETGNRIWRFYTVPGDPSKPFESAAMEAAAKTWGGDGWWEVGGGGTAWDSLAFDPELNLVYIGVGNGSPWNPHLRGNGTGDHLYLSSIVAVNADTGKLVWHYQTTPGDAWDYTATQHMILAELKIDGKDRKVIMQAPKNGFFYVLDRATGEFISAQAYTKVTWAKGIDQATGRPIENPGVRYKDKGKTVVPGALGGHNWQPMSFSPKTGLVYIPAQENSMFYQQTKNFTHRKTTEYSAPWNTGIDFAAPPTDGGGVAPSGFLLAWDPVAQREKWRVQHPMMWNGGTLVTAGDVVFQGTADGRFVAYHALSGDRLWVVNVGGGVIATPMTYEVDGVQHVSIMVGWGGAGAITGALPYNPPGRVLTFALSGRKALPEVTPQQALRLSAIASDGDMASFLRGAQQYLRNCVACHGFPGGNSGGLSDLARADEYVYEIFAEIVLEGELIDQGMPAFKHLLTPDQVKNIRHFLLTSRNRIAEAN